MESDGILFLKKAIEALEVAQRVRRHNVVCDREASYTVAECRDKAYEILELLFPRVHIEMCQTCLKLGKHSTENCLLEKPRCVRCGEESDHDEKMCHPTCCRCGEMEKDATHRDCPYYRREFIRHIFSKYYDTGDSEIKKVLDDVATLKRFLIRNGVSADAIRETLGC